MSALSDKKRGGTIGNKGGTGAPPKPEAEKKSKHVRMSQRLWKKIVDASGGKEWREFLECLIDSHTKNKQV